MVISPVDMEVLVMIITPLVTLGTAYGGVKAAQNGIYKRLDRIEEKQDGNAAKLSTHGERLARIEVTLDAWDKP